MLPEADLLLSGDLFERWTVVHAIIRETLSTAYEAELIVTTTNRDEDPAAFLGSPLTLCLTRGDADNPTRRLQGVVRAIEDLGTTGTHRYARIVLVPWLWTLTQRSDSRIFQDMPAVEVVKSVLRAAEVYQGPQGSLAAPSALTQLPPREYCVQYRESDFDFVLRLLQEEGVPFYFRHDGSGGETLVLVEGERSWGAPALLDHGDNVSISDTFHALAAVETLVAFDPHQVLRPTSTTLREFDFTRPRLHPTDLTHASPSAPGARALYDYPARATLHQYDEENGPAYRAYDGSRQARIRQEAEAMTALVVRGRGNVTSFAPGQRVMVDGHHAAGPDGRHLIVSVEHRYHAWGDLPADVQASERLTRTLEAAGLLTRNRTLGPRYENRFEMIPASVPYRPARNTARPLVYGTQTARVVGPADEEIYVDPHGRIKVQFHWDREGVEDEESSCWVRCAQGWAGSGWGFVFIPRIGMEVVVTFLEGDPDRPLVTGCVYNGENRPPYGLPGEKTKSTVKTNSSPTTGGYNELRFEDAAGQEQVYLQAERDHDVYVKNNQTITVDADRTKVIGGTERNTIVVDRITRVQGDESKEVFGNQETIVHGASGANTVADHHYRVTAEDSLTLTVGGSVVVMTPSEIQVLSTTVRVYGKKLVDIRGGLVKINCPESNAPFHGIKGQRRNLDAYLTRATRSLFRSMSPTDRPISLRMLSGVMPVVLLNFFRGSSSTNHLKPIEQALAVASSQFQTLRSSDATKHLAPTLLEIEDKVTQLIRQGLRYSTTLHDGVCLNGAVTCPALPWNRFLHRAANCYVRRGLSAMPIASNSSTMRVLEHCARVARLSIETFSV